MDKIKNLFYDDKSTDWCKIFLKQIVILILGDIAFRIIDEMKDASNGVLDEENFGHVTVCDINKSMLEVGQDRAKKVMITW